MAKYGIISGANNFIGVGAERINIIGGGSNNIHPYASGITLINCSGMNTSAFSGTNTTPWHNEKVIIENRVVTSPKSQVIDNTSDASNPSVVAMKYGMNYVDATLGDVYIQLDDPRKWTDSKVGFKRIDTSANLIYFIGYGSELLEFRALPQTGLLLYQGDYIELTTNGTDYFIAPMNFFNYGTYTPVVTLNGAGTAPQYTTASGSWTKMDGICWVDIYLNGDGGNEGSGAGQILISLPFVIGSGQLPINIPAGSSINGATEKVLNALLTSGLQTVAIQHLVAINQLGDFTGADQNNTTRSIRLSLKILLR